MVEKYINKAYFHIPGIFTSNECLVELFLELKKLFPNLFIDNVEIGSYYGSPSAIWNGGRVDLNNILSINQIDNIYKYYKENNIPVRFTFTNPLIKEEHLKDKLCNKILNIFNDGNNEIICNSECLEDYIRNNYNYRYISSTTKCIKDINEINKELNKDYKLVVLDYNFNNNFDFLKEIKNKDKLEILCNPVCCENCPKRSLHYNLLGQLQLYGMREEEFSCPHEKKAFHEAMESKLFVSKEKVNKYLKLGVSNFKLEGRTSNNFDLLEILIYYLIKPKFSIKAREMLIAELTRR